MLKYIIKYLFVAIFFMPLIGNAKGQKTETKINAIKEQFAPDKRQNVFEITYEYKKKKQLILKGKVSDKKAHDALIAEFPDAIDSIKVMPNDKWAQVRISVACLRTKPGHASEMASQAVMGTPLRLLEKEGDWWRVQTPDGYISYVIDNSLTEKSADEMNEWRNSERLIVTSFNQVNAYSSDITIAVRDIVTDLVNGVIVLGKFDENSNRSEITLPDGRVAWVDNKNVMPIEKWADQNFDSDLILNVAYSMMGTPYLWGGTSTKSLDCSGLAKVSYYANGIILMRDASQQAKTGYKIPAENWRDCKAGDLLFFGNAKTQRVTHVAIYDKDGTYIHSSGRVKCNSVDSESPSYLTTPFFHAVRIAGMEGTEGICRVIEHDWYFNDNK